jgi:hypothetical protein
MMEELAKLSASCATWKRFLHGIRVLGRCCSHLVLLLMEKLPESSRRPSGFANRVSCRCYQPRNSVCVDESILGEDHKAR